MMESTYSVSSLEGLVSSKRKLHLPPNSAASPKFRLMDLAWPMCRYPFGSGGKRVCTRPPYLLVCKSSMIISRTKWDWAGASAGVAATVLGSFLDVFIVFEWPGRSAGGWSRGPAPPKFQTAAGRSYGRRPPHG